MQLSMDEVRELLCNKKAPPVAAVASVIPTPKKQIVVCQRSWVMYGDVSQVGDELVIENCKNIRRWGTSGGLGQLAKSGPTSSTVLDDYGTVRVHVLSVVLRLDADGWR